MSATTVEKLAGLAETARTKSPRYYVPGGRLITDALGSTVDHLPFGDGVTVSTSMASHGDGWTAYVRVSTPAGEFSRSSGRFKQPHRAARDAFAGVVADMRASADAAEAVSGPQAADGGPAGAGVPADAAEAVSDAESAARARFAERARALGMPEWLTPDYGITGSRLLSWPATRGGRRVRIVGRLFNAHSEMVAVRDLRGEHSDYRATARRTVGDIVRAMRPATVAEAAAYVASGAPLTSYQAADVPADVMAAARDLAHAEALAEDAERVAAGRYSAGRGVRARDLLPGTVLHGGLIVRDVTFGHTTRSGRQVPGYILAWKLNGSGGYEDARPPVMSADDVIMCDAENLAIQRQDPAEAFPRRCRVEYVSSDGDRITGCVLGVWTDYAPGAPVPAGVASHYAEVATDAGAVRRISTPHLRRIDGEGGPLVDLPEWIRPGAMVAVDRRHDGVSVYRVADVSRDGIAYVSPHDVRDGDTSHVSGDRWRTLAYYVRGWRPATRDEIAMHFTAIVDSRERARQETSTGPHMAAQDIPFDRSDAARYDALVMGAITGGDATAMERERIAYAVAVVTSRVGAERLDAAFRAAARPGPAELTADVDAVFRAVLRTYATNPLADAEILAANFDRYAEAGQNSRAAEVLALIDEITAPPVPDAEVSHGGRRYRIRDGRVFVGDIDSGWTVAPSGNSMVLRDPDGRVMAAGYRNVRMLFANAGFQITREMGERGLGWGDAWPHGA